jgi:hypothetical protein
MEAGMKKNIMMLVVVVCLIAAVLIFVKTKQKGDEGPGQFKGQMIWVKCQNDKCNAEYQMDKADFYKTEEDLRYTRTNQPGYIPLTCQKCGKETIYRAYKCDKCGTVFFEAAGGDQYYPDLCPKCHYSKMKEIRDAKKKKGA